MTFFDIAQFGTVSAVVIAVTQIIKPFFAEKFHPLVCLVTGIVSGLGINLIEKGDWGLAVFGGVILGLTAAGLYDQRKAIPWKKLSGK